MFGTFPVSVFLYIDPLKQGLKRDNRLLATHKVKVFIHRSIKTRIETCIILEMLTRYVSFYT